MKNKVLLQVEGMDCANCALSITRSLEKTGLTSVTVNFATGEVHYQEVPSEKTDAAISAIRELGYRVVSRSDKSDREHKALDKKIAHDRSLTFKLVFCAVFTLPLMTHMVSDWHFLHDPLIQLSLSLPVMLVGWQHFGTSAFRSLRSGIPNMDVLITLGSGAAFFYSLSGMVQFGNDPQVADYLFFETAASIITLIFAGNLIEQRAVRRTTSSIRSLSSLQPATAKKVINDAGKEVTEVVAIETIQEGHLLRVNEGDRVPVDGIIRSGNCTLDESMMTGESLPVHRTIDQPATAGTLCTAGSFTLEATAVGSSTTLSHIIEMVKNAQHDKPEIQRLGDRISAIFVPAVVIISIATFCISFWLLNMASSAAIMHAVAVLVISCPCAMGLATPTAVMVGIGRAARNGILIKGGSTIEHLARTKTVVFDKTGTLTTGEFQIEKINLLDGEEMELKKILYHLELKSSHPIAASICRALKQQLPDGEHLNLTKVQEDKGIGINGWDENGTLYSAGSYAMVRHLTNDNSHSVYVLKDNRLIATVDLSDTIKPGAKEVISGLKSSGIKVILLSGDREAICKSVAGQLGIAEYYAQQLPADKMKRLQQLSAAGTTVMIGDGINDAPALATATVGISLSTATDVAIQSAQVILLHQQELDSLLRALAIGKMTYTTIRQNLFWAFFYNIIAIPFAAAGYLSPMIGALSMALSDVMVIGNSLRLNFRTIRINQNG